jgi:hypothetical protein
LRSSLPELALVYALLLSVPALVLFPLGQRDGRRGSPWGRIAVRAVLGSLVLSWVNVEGGGIAVPVPAWLMLGGFAEWIVSDPGYGRPDVTVPPSWLSVASTFCAYVVGALRGRALAAQASREEGPA